MAVPRVRDDPTKAARVLAKDLVDMQGIADMANPPVKVKTVELWRHRDGAGRTEVTVMPTPVRTFARTPVWDRREILEWLDALGRMTGVATRNARASASAKS